MIEENLPEGKYRLEIYERIRTIIKRDLTPEEHKEISHILKVYANTARTKSLAITQQQPLIHKWICDICLTEMIKTGMKENKPQSNKAARNKRVLKDHELQKKEKAQ